MGLAIVELYMDVEDEFGVWVTEERSKTILTVADLVTAVVELRCASVERERDFLDFRRAVSAVTGMDEEAVTPRTRLTDLFPWHGRARRWRQVHDILTREGVDLPPLKSHVSYLVGAICFGAVCGACILLTTKHPGPTAWVVGLVGLLLIVGALRHTYSPGFPKAATVAALLHLPMDREEIERKVIELVAVKAGVPVERVTPETRLNDSLRID